MPPVQEVCAPFHIDHRAKALPARNMRPVWPSPVRGECLDHALHLPPPPPERLYDSLELFTRHIAQLE